jgi:hypothetical protein
MSMVERLCLKHNDGKGCRVHIAEMAGATAIMSGNMLRDCKCRREEKDVMGFYASTFID